MYSSGALDGCFQVKNNLFSIQKQQKPCKNHDLPQLVFKSKTTCFWPGNNLFRTWKQFVFKSKTTCFQIKNNLFSNQKQLVFKSKTTCFSPENNKTPVKTLIYHNLFSNRKQLVFKSKTTCFQIKNNLFYVSGLKTTCFMFLGWKQLVSKNICLETRNNLFLDWRQPPLTLNVRFCNSRWLSLSLGGA